MLKLNEDAISLSRIKPIQIMGFLVVAITLCSLPSVCRADILVDTPPCCASYYQAYQEGWGYNGYYDNSGYYVDRSYHQNYGPNGYHRGYGEEGYGYQQSSLNDYQISEAYGHNEFWGDGYQDHRAFGDYSH